MYKITTEHGVEYIKSGRSIRSIEMWAAVTIGNNYKRIEYVGSNRSEDVERCQREIKDIQAGRNRMQVRQG